MTTKLDTVTSKEELAQELLKGLDAVQDYLNSVSKNQDAIESLCSFYYANNKLRSLLLFGIKYEVNNTSEIEELFRRTSIATHILALYSTTESSKRFLNATVVPTLIRVLDTDAALLTLEPSSSNSVASESLDQACDLLLQFTGDVLNRVEQEYKKCPLAIREAVAMIQQDTLAKFPSLQRIGTSVLFLRYIGPCLMQPKLFGLEVGRAISNDHLKALINISKIIQTISNGIVKNTVTTWSAHDAKIKKFVESKLEQMSSIGNKIMNEGEIETLRSLIDTDDGLLPTYAEQIKEEAINKLYETLVQSRPTIVRSRSDSQWQTARSPSSGTIVRSSTTVLNSKKFSEKRISKSKSLMSHDKDLTLNFLQTIGKAIRRQSSQLGKSEGSILDTFKIGLDVLLNMCEVQSESGFQEEDLLVSPSINELGPLFSSMKNSSNSTVQFSPLFSVTAPRKIRFSQNALRLLVVVGVLTILNANSTASVYVTVQSAKEREDSSDSAEDECEVRLALQFTDSRPANIDTDAFVGISPSKRLTEANWGSLAPISNLLDDYHIESRFYELNGSTALSLVIPTIDIRSVVDPVAKKTMLDQLMTKSPATWTSTDVFHYLECHGLGAYGSSFVSNSISGPELLRLEAEDLREIGVKKLGPLKKILSLIASLTPNKSNEVEEERAAQVQTYPIKCFYEEEIRVVKLSTDLTLGQIQEKLRSLFSENIRIKFKDSDDDLIKLNETSFEHFRDTVQSALKSQQSVAVHLTESRSRTSSRSSKALPDNILQTEDPEEALIVTSKHGSVQYMNDVASTLLGVSSRRYDRFVFTNYFSHSFEQLQQMYSDFIHENPALEFLAVQDSVAAKTGFENIAMNVSTVALPKSKIAYRFSFKITKDAGSESVSALQQIREKITKEKNPVILFDNSYKVQAFNKGATDTFGYKLHEIVGKDVSILFPHTPLEDIVRHTRATPRAVISQDKNGGLLSLTMTTSTLVDGSTKYYSVVFSS